MVIDICQELWLADINFKEEARVVSGSNTVTQVMKSACVSSVLEVPKFCVASPLSFVTSSVNFQKELL